jgi:hypothetical protein
MLDIIRQVFDNVDAVLDGTNVLVIVFSMMAACVIRVGTGSTPLTLLLLPGLIGGAFATVYLVQSQGLELPAEKDVTLLIAIAVGEMVSVLILLTGVRLARAVTAARDVR